MELSIKKIDYLFIVGVLCAPMNALRIGKIGPSEILIFIWCIINYRYIINNKINNIITVFFIAFGFCIISGSIFGFFFFPDECNIFEIVTYLYFFVVAIGIYNYFKSTSIVYIENIIEKFSKFSLLFYFMIYIYSILISKFIFGVPLWYGDGARFSPFGLNPHQFACFMGVIIIYFIYFFLYKGYKIYLFYIILSLYIAIQTKSSTLFFALFMTIVIFLFFYIVNKSNNKKECILQFLFMLSVLIIIFLLVGYDLLLDFIKNDQNGLERLQIFSSAQNIFSKNFIFGIGPGVHGTLPDGNMIELHNTYLEIFAMSGILGLCIYLYMMIKMFFMGIKTSYLIYALVILHFFGFSGFGMRRAIFWITFSLVFSIIYIQFKNKKFI